MIRPLLLTRRIAAATGAVRLGAALAAATLMAACAQPPAAPDPAAVPPVSSANPAEAAERTLTAYDWDLRTVRDGQGRALSGWSRDGQPPVRLHFEAGRVAARNLCNVVSASYSVDGDRLQIGRPVSTLRACPDRDLMALERQVAAQLPQVQRLALRSGAGHSVLLVLHLADQSRWELQGQPTPATRYGSAGEQVFLEVAPQQVGCHHPLMRNAQCLRVRDVHFGANGVRQSVGDWRVFHGSIEGYAHRPGVRNVLRLQRYPLTRHGQSPADGPSHAYVLDMVVETEQVR